MTVDKTVSALVRNTVIDLFTKNLMHMDGGIPRGWSWRFTEERGNVNHCAKYFYQQLLLINESF